MFSSLLFLSVSQEVGCSQLQRDPVVADLVEASSRSSQAAVAVLCFLTASGGSKTTRQARQKIVKIAIN